MVSLWSRSRMVTGAKYGIQYDIYAAFRALGKCDPVDLLGLGKPSCCIDVSIPASVWKV